MTNKPSLSGSSQASKKESLSSADLNPFNSFIKAAFWHLRLRNFYHWLEGRQKNLAPPICVHIEPTTDNQLRNLGNGEHAEELEPATFGREQLFELARFLADWGIKSVEVGGPGEPLLNKWTPLFLYQIVRHRMKVGLRTNGIEIDERIATGLQQCCSWIRFQINAGFRETYAMKNLCEPEFFMA